MDKIRSWLNFEEGTSQDELQEGLKGLTVASLKILYKEEKVKSSGTKAELIGRLVSDWKLKFDFGEESTDDPSTSSSIAHIPVCQYSLMEQRCFIYFYIHFHGPVRVSHT